jgi:pimeloyl-ACP methyl ester carboxylesterase
MNRTRPITLLLSVLFAFPVAGRAQDSQGLQFVESNGVRLAYRVVGQGEPLLLLHGFNGTDATWNPVVDDFSADYMLILPQLRGHGRSTNPSGEFTHREVAVDIFGLLDELGIDQLKAVGFSTGGMTLLHMATSQPERISAMVLVGATSYFPDQAREIMWSMDPDSMSQSQLEEIGRRHGGGIKQARALMAQFHGFKDSYEDMNFTPPLLSTITARTLIVHGDRDMFFPVSIPVEQYRAIPDSYLMVLPNSGHAAVPQDSEGRAYFVATVKRFFGGAWSCPAYCAGR